MPEQLQGTFGLVVLVVAILVTVVWVMFPFLVINHLEKIRKHVAAVEKALTEHATAQRDFLAEARQQFKSTGPIAR